MADSYRVGSKQRRNIYYRATPDQADMTQDKFVAVALEEDFGPVIVSALNAMCDQPETPES